MGEEGEEVGSTGAKTARPSGGEDSEGVGVRECWREAYEPQWWGDRRPGGDERMRGSVPARDARSVRIYPEKIFQEDIS